MTTKIFFILVCFILNFGMSFAQKPNTINPNETIKDILENFHFYGRLCVQSVTAFNGYSAIQNGASDLGFKGESNISKGIIMFANLEVGVNMVDNNNKILIKDDPGYAVGEENNAVSSRLGFIGIKTKYGSFTWGKQWAPYYDIGGFTDRLYEFGGDAQGTYPNGTDGGISGTGRAGNSLQYRNRVGPLKLAFQIQNRHNFNNQENNKKFADTFGASLVCETNSKISFGVAFNKVCDGIVKPDINQPKKGDEAVIAGIMFQNSNLTIGSIYSVFSNHATDNLGNYFSGYGYELALTYNFQNNFEVEFGFNYKEPYGSNNGLYKIEYFVGGLSYHFKKLSMVFAELKFDRSRQFDGTYMQSIIGFGAQLGF